MALHDRGGLRGSEMRRVQRQLRRTRWALVAEHVADAFWPAFVVLCGALALGLIGGYAALGPLGHRVLLAVLALVFLGALIWGGNRYRNPTAAEVEDRLDSADPKRPLATLRDGLAVGEGQEVPETLWRAFRDRARAAAAALTARAPDLRLADRDRWGLRLLAPALLIAGIIATGGSWGDRLAAIADPAPLTPPAAAAAAARDPVAEAWATPPAYTGLATVYLERRENAAPIQLPQGSQITVRVTDLPGLPVLDAPEALGMGAFATLGGGLSEATGILAESGTLSVTSGEAVLADWAIEMIPDAPPAIELEGRPTVTVTRSLSLAFNAQDDYGVSAAWAEIAPEGHDPEAAKGLPLPVISFGLPLPITGDTRDVGDVAIRDYTAHPWAGAEVVLQLYAEDGAAQVGQSEPMTITLPGRRFTHPLARALVEQRREIALDYGEAYRVLDMLQAVTRRPDDLFDDPGVFLVVRSAIRRLAHAVGTETVPDAAPDVVELLWQAALALEDGDLSSAMERLRQAQEALREALESGSEEDIRRAMDELRAALNEYLQQLAQQQRNNPNQQQQGQMDPNQTLSQQDLQDMLDRLQESAESGMREQARDMLSQLNQLLENLQSAQSQQQGQQSPGQQALQDLQEMIQRQRDLSDRTHDELRQRQREQQQGQQGQQQGRQPGQQGQQQPGWGEGQGRGDEHGQQGQQQGQGRGDPNMQGGQPGQGGLADQQEALRRQLENLARGLGSDDAARALEEAVRSMGDARDDLSDGNNSDAVRDQMDALDRLNEGAEALAQDVQQGQGQTQAQGNRDGEGQGPDADRSDPFDRPSSSFGPLDGKSTRVPDRALVDRARKLMEELRRRAAEPSRPQLELDYLDRLMDRF